MADRVVIAARPRLVVGKKVALLRRQGILPANVFGKGLDSLSLELDAREFGRTIKGSNVRHLFDLSIEGEASPRPVVIRGMMRKGGTGEPTHIDFYQVDVTRPINATVPLVLTGTAPAVHDLAGVLFQALDTIHIRCLPLAIPEAIYVDAGKLVSFDITVTVADILPVPNVELLPDPSVVIASVAPPRVRLDA